MVAAPTSFDFNAARMRDAAAEGYSFLGVSFVGHLPRKESAIFVGVQGWKIPFALDRTTVVQLLPSTYSVSIFRSGALKAGTLDLAAGEFAILQFRFSKIGITFSGWNPATVLRVSSLTATVPEAGDAQ